MDYSFVYIWLGIIILTVAMEAFSSQMISIWFSVGAVPALILAAFGAPVWLQVPIFLIASAVLVIFTRPIARRLLKKPMAHTNADRIIGEIAIVIGDIDNDEARGLVTINGQQWTARSRNGERLCEGTKVIVRSIEGVKVIVDEFAEIKEEEMVCRT